MYCSVAKYTHFVVVFLPVIFFTLMCSLGSRLLVELVDERETSSLDFSNTLSCSVLVLSLCVGEVWRVNVCEVRGAMVKVLLLLLDTSGRSEVSRGGKDRAAILEASLRSSRSLHTTGCTERALQNAISYEI